MKVLFLIILISLAAIAADDVDEAVTQLKDEIAKINQEITGLCEDSTTMNQLSAECQNELKTGVCINPVNLKSVEFLMCSDELQTIGKQVTELLTQRLELQMKLDVQLIKKNFRGLISDNNTKRENQLIIRGIDILLNSDEIYKLKEIYNDDDKDTQMIIFVEELKSKLSDIIEKLTKIHNSECNNPLGNLVRLLDVSELLKTLGNDILFTLFDDIKHNFMLWFNSVTNTYKGQIQTKVENYEGMIEDIKKDPTLTTEEKMKKINEIIEKFHDELTDDCNCSDIDQFKPRFNLLPNLIQTLTGERSALRIIFEAILYILWLIPYSLYRLFVLIFI